MMRVKSWAFVLAGALTVSGILGGYKYLQISSAIAAAKAMPEPAETVDVAVVQAGTWAATSRTVGTVVAKRHVELRNELPGRVAEVGFTSGGIVEEGQVLVRFETRAEEADLAAAKAEADLARLTLERRQRLVRSQAGAQADLDQAQAHLAAARARVDALEVRIAKKTLRAPFKARVGIHDLQPGAYLAEGTLIVTLQGIDPDAYVDFTFPQDEAAALHVGNPVRLAGKGLPDTGLDARIVARDAVVDGASRAVKLRAVATGLGLTLQPGGFLEVLATTTEAHQALFVPLTAVRRAPHGDHVFAVVEEDGRLRARQRFVRLGPVQGDRVVVTGGLDAGERIATKGSFKLRDGALVLVGSPPAH